MTIECEICMTGEGSDLTVSATIESNPDEALTTRENVKMGARK